ncbi:hypothetical protein CYMTET_13888 [Cymbomonas tetramitiformis]|uniref:Uncharacterized protein n=1 Tax=Cymbomonas tetramitiformis TaxID=36881 RepID=A0AAE0GHG8_9CHLO|nr:hypothetical protein CYMTET_13888 [Cymbomonas tetramitiformis]
MSKEVQASAVFVHLTLVWLMLVSPGSTDASNSSEPISFVVGTVSTCTDLQIYTGQNGTSGYEDWSDTTGYSCQAWVDKEWCDASGELGAGWKDAYGAFEDWSRLESHPLCASNVEYALPTEYCCGCDGGCITSLSCDPQVHMDADISIRVGENDESLVWSLSEWDAFNETYVQLAEGGNYTLHKNETEAHVIVSMCLLKSAVFGIQISGSSSATSHLSVWYNETCALVFEATALDAANDTLIVFGPEVNSTCIDYSVPAIISNLSESGCKSTIVAGNSYYAGQQLISLMRDDSVDTICLNANALVNQNLPVLKHSLTLEGHCGATGGFEEYIVLIQENPDYLFDLCYVDAAGLSQLFKLEEQTGSLLTLTIYRVTLKNAYDFAVSVTGNILFMDFAVVSDTYTVTSDALAPVLLTNGAEADLRRIILRRNYIRGSTAGGVAIWESELNISDSVFLENSGKGSAMCGRKRDGGRRQGRVPRCALFHGGMRADP